MIVIELLTIIYGYMAHLTRPEIQRRFGRGWRDIVSYTVGVVLVCPAFIVLLYSLLRLAGYAAMEARRLTVIAVVAYYAAFGPFGFGTFIAWAIEE